MLFGASCSRFAMLATNNNTYGATIVAAALSGNGLGQVVHTNASVHQGPW